LCCIEHIRLLNFYVRKENLMTNVNNFHENQVSWNVEGIDVHATLACPDGEGPFPAVMFVAGSGPTDRDWNTPLIPGSGGAGAMLSKALKKSGFITLRYDKRPSGPHVQENMKLLAGKISMQGHVDELAGGMRLLAGHGKVNPGKIFVLTNSEGCVHGLNYQTQVGITPFAGLVLTSAFARAAGELAHEQIAAQMGTIPGGEVLLAAYDAAITDFVAGRPVVLDENLPASLRQVIQAITQPINQPFARELWIFNPLTKLAQVTAPVLLVFGKKDIQVNWLTDGSLFETVAKDHPNISVVYCDNANHVLKFEPKPREQLTAAEVMASYSSADVMLDPDPVEKIVNWLKALSE
jgi:pimeloyl-ACP methyl ester carboxylesterase